MSSSVNRSEITGKRKKRSVPSLPRNVTAGDKESQVKELEIELEALFEYHRELRRHKVFIGPEMLESRSIDAAIAALMEESILTLSSLGEVVYGGLRVLAVEPVTMTSVKNTVILIGQRMAYGVPNDEADVLTDKSESCFWCWETRDVSNIPQCVRGKIILRRICRTMIHHRIIAISEMMALMQKPEHSYATLNKAWRILAKVRNEEDIRSLIQALEQKISSDMDEKKAEREEKLLLKQLDKCRKAVQGVKESMHSGVQTVGPCHPVKKKPASLDHDINSGEELEEEDPDESDNESDDYGSTFRCVIN